MTWKERRKLSYLINEFDDINLPYQYIECSDQELINMIIDFFQNGSKLIYPAKSYFVAIIYAHYLSKYFNIDFFIILNDKELLPDDKFFIPYLLGKNIYDEVLKTISNIEKFQAINATLKYFKQEFLIGDE